MATGRSLSITICSSICLCCSSLSLPSTLSSSSAVKLNLLGMSPTEIQVFLKV